MQHSGKYRKLYNFDVFGFTVKHEFTLGYTFGYTIEKDISKTLKYLHIFWEFEKKGENESNTRLNVIKDDSNDYF